MSRKPMGRKPMPHFSIDRSPRKKPGVSLDTLLWVAFSIVVGAVIIAGLL